MIIFCFERKKWNDVHWAVENREFFHHAQCSKLCSSLIVSIYIEQLGFLSNRRYSYDTVNRHFASAKSTEKKIISPLHRLILPILAIMRNGRETRQQRSCEHKKGWCDYDVVNAGKWRMMLCFIRKTGESYCERWASIAEGNASGTHFDGRRV